MRLDYAEINQNKLMRILRRNGLVYLFKRAVYRFFWGPVIRCLAPRSFSIQGEFYKYFRSSYNTTFINERTVEVPFFRKIIAGFQGKSVLEIGNVLSHYESAWWLVVDKFEKYPGVNNQDVLEYFPTQRHDLIVAISTFEHIGFDEHPRDPQKLSKVLDHLQLNCMSIGSQLWFSIPVGWNPDLDRKIFERELSYESCIFLERNTFLNTWRECKSVDAQWLNRPYRMFPTALLIIKMQKST